MKVSARSIKAIGKIITGDSGISPYRSGPKLVDLFNEYGADDFYGQGFPSRWQYAEDQLRRLNDTPALSALIREVLDPREFMDTKFDQQVASDFLNARLKFDGYEIVLVGGIARVRDVEGSDVCQRRSKSGHFSPVENWSPIASLLAPSPPSSCP